VRTLIVLALVMALSDVLSARQRFIEGVFTATDAGTPIELIAWAETTRAGVFRVHNGSLEDAPNLPRTYRFLVNMGSYDVIGVLATTTAVFSKPLDTLDRKDLPFSNTKLAIATHEIGVPELEDWARVERLRKSLKATPEQPMIFFLILTNGANVRYYPFFIDRK
jgi:hypothetical protein